MWQKNLLWQVPWAILRKLGKPELDYLFHELHYLCPELRLSFTGSSWSIRWNVSVYQKKKLQIVFLLLCTAKLLERVAYKCDVYFFISQNLFFLRKWNVLIRVGWPFLLYSCTSNLSWLNWTLYLSIECMVSLSRSIKKIALNYMDNLRRIVTFPILSSLTHIEFQGHGCT